MFITLKHCFRQCFFALSIFTLCHAHGLASGATPDAAPVAEVLSLPETVSKYGRFTVRASGGRQVVEGGVFTPPEKLPVSSTAAHVIVINYTEKELLYYRKVSAGVYEPVIGYAVMTPDASFLPRPEVRGKVRAIDLKPSWCPGKMTRRMYPELPKGCLPPDHPDNMMGIVKFLINWQGVKDWEAVRLHGTLGYKEGAFWEEETLGCTSLTNEAILELVAKLGPGAVAAGIEFVAISGQKSEVLSPEALQRLRHTAL
jgi:hypothetical protein